MGKLKGIISVYEAIPHSILEYVRRMEEKSERVRRLSYSREEKLGEKVRSMSFSELARRKLTQQQIDADGMLSISNWVVFRACQQGADLQKELLLVSHFVSAEQMNGIGGYYWSVMQASLRYLPLLLA
jgi:hypothetical protein